MQLAILPDVTVPLPGLVFIDRALRIGSMENIYRLGAVSTSNANGRACWYVDFSEFTVGHDFLSLPASGQAVGRTRRFSLCRRPVSCGRHQGALHSSFAAAKTRARFSDVYLTFFRAAATELPHREEHRPPVRRRTRQTARREGSLLLRRLSYFSLIKLRGTT